MMVFMYTSVLYIQIFLKEFTQHTFVYDSYFTTTVNNGCQGAIIDNKRHTPICLLEEKDRKKIQNWRLCLGTSLKAHAVWIMH